MDALDVNPRIRSVHGQIAGTGGVLLVTTEQKAFVAVSCPSERHVREPRCGRGLIFGLIRLRSPTFISIHNQCVCRAKTRHMGL